jgi:hypothetical protein
MVVSRVRVVGSLQTSPFDLHNTTQTTLLQPLITCSSVIACMQFYGRLHAILRPLTCSSVTAYMQFYDRLHAVLKMLTCSPMTPCMQFYKRLRAVL